MAWCCSRLWGKNLCSARRLLHVCALLFWIDFFCHFYCTHAFSNAQLEELATPVLCDVLCSFFCWAAPFFRERVCELKKIVITTCSRFGCEASGWYEIDCPNLLQKKEKKVAPICGFFFSILPPLPLFFYCVTRCSFFSMMRTLSLNPISSPHPSHSPSIAS